MCGLSRLHISHIEKQTKLLGPYVRFAIWVHGCCFTCDGCLAANFKEGPYYSISIDSLSEQIVQSNCEGITISGGEPFLQVNELLTLIQECKAHRDIGVIVYSGFTIDEILEDKYKAPLLEEIDILIDGKYIKELDDGRAYVGSSNQIIHYLSSRYVSVGKEYYSSGRRRAEIKFTHNQTILIGVPSKSVLAVWEDIKEKNGGISNDF